MRLLKISSAILFSAVLSGCVTPPDAPFCRPLEMRKEVKDVEGVGRVVLNRPNPVCQKEIGEPTCGYCVWSISDTTKYVGEAKATHLFKKPWSQIKSEAILAPPESYAKVKEFVINICKKTEECSRNITRWRLKLNSLEPASR